MQLNLLRRGLAEVDGLRAGFEYLDETKSPGNSAQTRVDLSHQATYAEEQQWTALETIYDASDAFFRDFQETAKNLNCPRISALSKSFDNAKAMRDSACAVFRDTLNGSTDLTFNKTFAVVSLSYIISKVLGDRLKDDRILRGIHVWKRSIQDEGDKNAFDKLAERLWPELIRQSPHRLGVIVSSPCRLFARPRPLRRAFGPVSSSPVVTPTPIHFAPLATPNVPSAPGPVPTLEQALQDSASNSAHPRQQKVRRRARVEEEGPDPAPPAKKPKKGKKARDQTDDNGSETRFPP